MEGVNILTQTEIMISSPMMIWVLIVALICMIFGVITFIVVDEWGFLVPAALGVCLYISITFGAWDTYPSGRYEYQATIDETVTFIELHERYDVVGRDGKIWILEDKEE